jgi:hypothetical protein
MKKRKRIKVSHETPFCLLKDSLKFNDYQYALPHLLEENEEYRNHFLKCKEDGVEIYLDNSLHELGYAMDNDILLKWINILEPSNFFIPDVWEDWRGSLKNAQEWANIKVPENTTKVAVVQAYNYTQASHLVLDYQELGYKKIAFSYGASYYNTLCPHPNKDFGKAMGRFTVISRMEEDGILNRHTMVHLLGTAWPAEFGMYSNFDFIESIDTSNPVMAAIDNLEYGDLGLDYKPIANMNNFQDIDKSLIYYGTLEHNIWKFREINGL